MVNMLRNLQEIHQISKQFSFQNKQIQKNIGLPSKSSSAFSKWKSGSGSSGPWNDELVLWSSQQDSTGRSNLPVNSLYLGMSDNVVISQNSPLKWETYHKPLAIGFWGTSHLQPSSWRQVPRPKSTGWWLSPWKMMEFVSWDDFSIPNMMGKSFKIPYGSSHHQSDYYWLTNINHYLTKPPSSPSFGGEQLATLGSHPWHRSSFSHLSADTLERCVQSIQGCQERMVNNVKHILNICSYLFWLYKTLH